MKAMQALLVVTALVLAPASVALASDKLEDCKETKKLFWDAIQNDKFFENAYGYAVFPNIGKGGLGVGAARGKGCVFEQGDMIGTTAMTQVTVGFQAGGEAFSQMIFFQDKRALDEFTSGNFEFSAQASATALTASASASTGTTGSKAGASGGKKDAATVGEYYKGMAVFTIAKGGLMYEASLGGQKFSYDAVN